MFSFVLFFSIIFLFIMHTSEGFTNLCLITSGYCSELSTFGKCFKRLVVLIVGFQLLTIL